MTPVHTTHLNDELTNRLKSDLKIVGYKYVGRSKDRYDNYYTTYELKVPKELTENREVISRVIITRLK